MYRVFCFARGAERERRASLLFRMGTNALWDAAAASKINEQSPEPAARGFVEFQRRGLFAGQRRREVDAELRIGVVGLVHELEGCSDRFFSDRADCEGVNAAFLRGAEGCEAVQVGGCREQLVVHIELHGVRVLNLVVNLRALVSIRGIEIRVPLGNAGRAAAGALVGSACGSVDLEVIPYRLTEVGAFRRAHLPIADILTVLRRRGEVDAEFDRVARGDILRDGNIVGRAENGSLDIVEGVTRRPGAGARVQKVPSLCRGHIREQNRAVRDGDVVDELHTVAAAGGIHE